MRRQLRLRLPHEERIVTSPVFARHETFHPRYGWLKKGFDEACRDPEIFIAEDAHIRLGVGKNMVRSIRYWTHAFGVLAYDEDAPGRSKPSRPTDFGLQLLADDGYDPFLENLGSLWLLHWRLLNGGEATGWQYAFFQHTRPELTADELVKGFQELLRTQYEGASFATSSLKKDANCILRMYGELPRRAVSEESIQCPFAELGLLAATEQTKTFTFRMGSKPGFSDSLLTAICLEYAGERSTARTVALPQLLHGERSPGLAFKLTESALYHALENVVMTRTDLGLSDTAGMIQLSFPKRWDRTRDALIDRHYAQVMGTEAVA